VILYYAVAYVGTYATVALFLGRGGSFRDPTWVFFAQILMLVPAASAILLQRFVFREPVRESLAIRLRPNRWFAVAWLLPLALAVAALGLELLQPGVTFDGSLEPAVKRAYLSEGQVAQARTLALRLSVPTIVLLAASWLPFSLTMSLVAGCGEEIGWRGFLHGALRPLGFWRCALLTGVFWALWHVPLVALGYGFPLHPRSGVVVMFVCLALSAVIYAYIRERSGSSVAAGLYHSSSSAALLIAVAPAEGGSDLTINASGLTQVALVILVIGALALHDRFLSANPVMFSRAPARSENQNR
jgi:membrane protease YdiL (CAAX protease family)